MKTSKAALILAAPLLLPLSAQSAVSAQETVLYSFSTVGPGGFGGAAVPHAGLVLATDGNFYGTTYQGGANDNGLSGPGGDGTVYKIKLEQSPSCIRSEPMRTTAGTRMLR